MIDRALRGHKEKMLEPTARRLKHLRPALITLLGLALGLTAAAFATLGLPLVALIFWILNRLCDGLDGEIARRSERQSDFGGYLDVMSDSLVYTAIPLGLTIWLNDSATWLALAVLLSSFYINTVAWMYLSALLEKRALGSRASGEKTSITMPRGLIEGAETILFFCLFLIFPVFLSQLFWLMAGLVLITGLQRLLWARRRL